MPLGAYCVPFGALWKAFSVFSVSLSSTRSVCTSSGQTEDWKAGKKRIVSFDGEQAHTVTEQSQVRLNKPRTNQLHLTVGEHNEIEPTMIDTTTAP